jgi:DNA-directed RNA polymerase beta subunit
MTSGANARGSLVSRDAFIAHQARGWLIERYMTVSDETTVYICPKCELPCLANPSRLLYTCEVCGSTDPVPPTKVPRSLLLLYGYNAAMGTKIRMKTGPVNAGASSGSAGGSSSGPIIEELD